MPIPFRFCLCADDYAMTAGVSRGIREALDAGALTATSVMTTSPVWAEEAEPLRPFGARASIGVHLNLTLGEPLGPMPILAPAGRLPPVSTLLKLARLGALPTDEIAQEIDRQLDRFVEVWGRPPDHLDGHQHVHVFDGIRALVLATLGRRGWRPLLRDCSDRPTRIVRRGAPLTKALGLAWLARGFRAQSENEGYQTNQGFAGFSSFDTKADFGADLARFLRAPGPRHLVMCHPGYVDDTLRALDPVVESRERELSFLCSPGFAALLRSRAATLTTWRDER